MISTVTLHGRKDYPDFAIEETDSKFAWTWCPPRANAESDLGQLDPKTGSPSPANALQECASFSEEGMCL